MVVIPDESHKFTENTAAVYTKNFQVNALTLILNSRCIQVEQSYYATECIRTEVYLLCSLVGHICPAAEVLTILATSTYLVYITYW